MAPDGNSGGGGENLPASTHLGVMNMLPAMANPLAALFKNSRLFAMRMTP